MYQTNGKIESKEDVLRLNLLIMKNRARLDKLIGDNGDYSKILKQSQKLDKLINRKMAIVYQQWLYSLKIKPFLQFYQHSNK